ncbi:MAG: TIGR03905 family TSCPD domain-containing protein [Atopobiaceae bacterium]
MFHFDFRPRGVCSRAIHIDLSDDGKTIENVSFEGGCNGNLKAIGLLVQGKSADGIADILAGNTCGPRPTSCADQLSKALKQAEAAAQQEA